MATYYAIGSGNWTWTSANTANWSLSSGGATAGVAPTSSDTVIFDSNSTTNTVTWTTGVCSSLSCRAGTGLFAGTIAGSTAKSIAGSFDLAGTYTSTGALTFSSTSSGNTITCAGNTLGQCTFNGVGGVWTLQDTFKAPATLTLTNGDFEGNGQSITCGGMNLSNSNTRTFNISNCSITLNGTSGSIFSTSTITGLTFNATGSTVTCTDTGASSKSFSLGLTITHPTFVLANNNSGGYSFSGSAGTNIIQGITFGTGTTHTFLANNTYKFNTAPILSGSAGNVITIISSSGGTAATFTYTGGVVSGNYVSVKDNTPTQTNTWLAGANGTLVSNTGNWLYLIPLSVQVQPTNSAYTINGVKIV